MKEISDLSRLALYHETDKWNHHWYTDHYDFFLRDFRSKPVKLLEIGVGGYQFPDRGGASLKMWRDYFPQGNIWGIDIHDKSQLTGDRIQIMQGSQDDLQFLRQVYNKMGGMDVIIDDGSHQVAHQIASFYHLFPMLSSGGFYIIEDTETSYWPDYGGSQDPNHPNTTVNHFKNYIHGLNHECIANYPVSDFNREIEFITFVKNIIIIKKGENK